ncbi:hypothetical protein [Spiroplasma phoeniceum]|uniref:hypothetical protein n=1 Tax=Spiroplasma phoeniceum TaxID=47835 RepID=UPI0033651867
MLYILSVQPNMLSSAPDINHPSDPSQNMAFGGIFISTAIGAFIATLIMGLSANMPVRLAPGMGLNAIFTFNVVLLIKWIRISRGFNCCNAFSNIFLPYFNN